MAYISFQPSGNYSTKLYTGTGSSLAITGVGFQPDLVWIKIEIRLISMFLRMQLEELPIILKLMMGWVKPQTQNLLKVLIQMGLQLER